MKTILKQLAASILAGAAILSTTATYANTSNTQGNTPKMQQLAYMYYTRSYPRYYPRYYHRVYYRNYYRPYHYHHYRYHPYRHRHHYYRYRHWR